MSGFTRLDVGIGSVAGLSVRVSMLILNRYKKSERILMEPSICGISISAQVETNNEPLKLEPNFCSFIVFTVENFTPQTVFQLYT